MLSTALAARRMSLLIYKCPLSGTAIEILAPSRKLRDGDQEPNHLLPRVIAER